MSISLRLESSIESELNKYAKMVGKPKSELIRNLITEFLEKESTRHSPWELGKDVFGRTGSGKGNLSYDRKTVLKEKLRAKKSNH